METMEGYKVGSYPRIGSLYHTHPSGRGLGISQSTVERAVAHSGEDINRRNDLA